jgi:hypothetical protein
MEKWFCCRWRQTKNIILENIKIDEMEKLNNTLKISDLLSILPAWKINNRFIYKNHTGHTFKLNTLFESTPPNSNMFYLITEIEGIQIPIWFWNKYNENSDKYGDFLAFVEK